MAVRELAVKVIQQFTGATTAVVPPLLPECIIGPGYNVQAKQSHSVAYSGSAMTVPYPNKQVGEYVDLGTLETWEKNEVPYPVRVFLSSLKKVTASSPTGHFGSSVKKAGTTQNGTKTITGCSPVFSPGDVGKKIYIHNGSDDGEKTIASVSAGGLTVTISEANFTASEAVEISLLPSTKKVQRLYDAGGFTKSRVGDKIQLGPSYTTEYTITAIDPSYNWVEISLSISPTSEPTPWRMIAEVSELELTRDTDFTVDRDNVYLADGITDATDPSGVVSYALVKVSYRALKPALSTETQYVESETDISDLVGVITEANPLALALQKALENTTTRVNFTGMDVNANVKSGITEFDSMAKLSISDVLARIIDEDLYVLPLLSQKTSMHSELDTHVTDASDPNGIYNRERVGVINTALIDETVLQLEETETSWDIRGVTEVVAMPDESKLYSKTGRLWSRGSGEFPDFDDSVSPKPVNPLTDLVRLSGGSVPGNNGYRGIESSEQLLVRSPAGSANWGYVAADSNKLRSCTFTLSVANNAGLVRLIGANGSFGFLPSVPSFPYSAIAYLPGAMQGIPCNITAYDAVNKVYVDTNIPYDVSYESTGASQVAIHPFDDVFAPPGLTAVREEVVDSLGGTSVDASGNVTTTDDLFISDDVGIPLYLDGANAGFYIIETYADAKNVKVTGWTGGVQAALNGAIARLKLTGVPAEFASVVAPVASCKLRYSGKGNLLSGNTVNLSNNIDGFAAGTWGPGDVGRKIRVTYPAVGGWSEQIEITAVVDDTEITTSKAFTAVEAVKVSIADQAYVDETVKITNLSDSNNLFLNKGWAQKYAGNELCSIDVTGIGTFGFGDSKRNVRVLGGSYSGLSMTIQAVRPEELVVTGSPFSGGNDVSGFPLVFTSTPGNNVLKLKNINSVYPADESAKSYSVERDFRYLDLNNETLTSKVEAGDIIRINTPEAIAGDYEILSVLSDSTVLLKQGNAFSLNALPLVFDGSSLDNITYELVRVKSKDEQAETIKNYAAAIFNRRMILVWPDVFRMDINGEIKEVPGYYLGAILGAMYAGLPPQQPLSRLGMLGINRLIHSKIDGYFTRTQLNTIASGGVLIVHMETDADVPYIRHQLTTDVTDIKRAEPSVTKIIDYISRIVKQEFTPYLGKYNINEPLLSQLKNVAQSIVEFVENQVDINAGPLVNEIRFEKLAQSTVNLDEVEAEIYVDVPIPFNNLTITIIA